MLVVRVVRSACEAPHPGPPKELWRFRRVSSTRHDRGADDPDLTKRDSDDDASLVRTHFARVAQNPPIAVDEGSQLLMGLLIVRSSI